MNRPFVSDDSIVDSLYRRLFDEAQEPLALFQISDGRILRANAAFCRMLGNNVQDVEQSNLADLILLESQAAADLAKLEQESHLLEFDARIAATEQPLRCEASVMVEHGVATGLLRSTPVRWSDQRLRCNLEELLNDVDAIVWECSLSDWRFTYVSPKAVAIAGYPLTDWLTESDFLPNIIHPEDRQLAMDFCRESTLRGTDHEMEYRMITADGRIVWIHDVVHVVKDAAGRPTGMRGVMVDITRRRESEDALRSSELERERAERVGALIKADLTPAGDWLRPPEALCRLLGYSVRQLQHRGLLELLHGDDRESARTRIAELLSGKLDAFDCEWRFLRIDEEAVWTEVSCTVASAVDGTPDRLLMYLKDVTERKEAEAALRRSEESLARAQQIARIGTWQADAQTGRTTGSAETFRILGIDGAQQISLQQYFDQIVHEDDRVALQEAHQKALQLGIIRPMQYRIRRQSDGAIRHVRAEAEFQDAARTQQFGTLQDITELIETRDRLHQSEIRYRTIVETTQEWIWETDDRGTITFSNPAIHSTLGYRPHEVLGRSMLEFLITDDDPNGDDSHQRQFFDRRGWSHRVLRWRHRDGREKILESNGLPVLDQGSRLTGFRGSDRDITDRVQAEEELRQHQHLLAHVSRLSTMGEMVAGIAHEVNQPLAAIAAYAKASERQLTKSNVNEPAVDQWLQQIGQQAVRCGDIIRRLRGFVKRGDGQRDRVPLRDLVHDSFSLLQADARQQGVQFRTDRLVETVQVQVCKVQVQQVLVNLFRNAIDALHQTPQPQISVSARELPDGLQIRVRDNGPGIEQQMQSHLFEAFYSTKEEGMGMGLAISRSIIESHGGKLTIRPDSKRGAEFIIELPQAVRHKESEPDDGPADLPGG